jgi:hypothetical protein
VRRRRPFKGCKLPARTAGQPDSTPLTPVGRLEAMEKRLEAMMQPALDEFYVTLSSEQKARFNTLRQSAGP